MRIDHIISVAAQCVIGKYITRPYTTCLKTAEVISTEKKSVVHFDVFSEAMKSFVADSIVGTDSAESSADHRR